MQKLPTSTCTHYHVVLIICSFEDRMANYGPEVFYDNFQNLGCGILLSFLNIFAKLIRVRILKYAVTMVSMNELTASYHSEIGT